MRFGYLHFAFLGQESLWAGEASECAAEQDRFWDYHDALFSNQAGENKGAFDKVNLKRIAADAGLDIAAFDECLDSGRQAGIVQQESDWSRSLGIQSTPTFLVGDSPVVGAQPFDVFRQIIDQSLGR